MKEKMRNNILIPFRIVLGLIKIFIIALSTPLVVMLSLGGDDRFIDWLINFEKRGINERKNKNNNTRR